MKKQALKKLSVLWFCVKLEPGMRLYISGSRSYTKDRQLTTNRQLLEFSQE